MKNKDRYLMVNTKDKSVRIDFSMVCELKGVNFRDGERAIGLYHPGEKSTIIPFPTEVERDTKLKELIALFNTYHDLNSEREDRLQMRL